MGTLLCVLNRHFFKTANAAKCKIVLDLPSENTGGYHCESYSGKPQLQIDKIARFHSDNTSLTVGEADFCHGLEAIAPPSDESAQRTKV